MNVKKRSIPDEIQEKDGKQFLIRRKLVKTKMLDKDGQITEVEKVNEISYRIDANFMPEHPEEICEEYMRNYVKAKGKDAVIWYLALWKNGIDTNNTSENNIDANTEYRKLSLREIVNIFIEDKKYGLDGAVEPLTRRSKKDIIAADLDKWLEEEAAKGKKK